MKNLTFILVLIGCFSFVTQTNAGDNRSSQLKAEKVCTPQVDIFSATNMESIVGLTGDQKLVSYEVVLNCPNDHIYKWDLGTEYSGDFKAIMSSVKKDAIPGSLLFVDEMKTSSGETIPQVLFYLRNGY